MTDIKDYEKILVEARELVERKNSDYAGDKDFLGNFKMSQMMGLKPSQGVLIRIGDKYARICQLSQKSASVPEETIKDTLIDLINYSVFMILCLEEEKGDVDGSL
jgi:hypothetical protein